MRWAVRAKRGRPGCVRLLGYARGEWADAARGLEQARGRGKKWPQERVSGLGWEVRFGLGFSSFLILFTLSFLFLIQTKFEFKYKIEFKPHSNN